MSGTISDPGGRGTRATRRRNGSNRMFRKVTVWREGGRALRLPFTTTPNFSYKWLASFALASAPVASTAGNCHIRENRTPSLEVFRTSSARPRESRSTAAARVIATGAGFFLADGNFSAIPSFRARHHFAAGQSPHRGDFGVQTVAPSSIIA